jgi:thiol-disulfide isomerase/thioredoxin
MNPRHAVPALTLACTLGCQGAETAAPAPKASTTETAAVAEKPAAAALPETIHGIAWFEDAPEAARERALREHKPLLVDLWAPWCHTCLSMKNFVLTAEHLGELAGQYVFLSINTERAEHAWLLQKLPVDAWPTFHVADPEAWTGRGRWVGAASAAQFGDFLRDGRRAFELARKGKLPENDPLAILLRGDELAGQKKFAEAAALYKEAVARGGADFARKPDALVSQISSLYRAEQHDACVELGIASMNDTGSSVSAADFAVYALSCAEKLPARDPRAKSVHKAAEARLTAACEGGKFTLTPDDRSDACSMLRDAREALGDAAGARRAVEQRLAILEKASMGLPDDVALTYDWARAESLVALERGAEALAFLEAREKGLPRDYNPPHYQARVHKALGQWQSGLDAIERALGRAYGPRKASMLGLKADLLLGAGERSKAHDVLEQQLAAYRELPEGQKQPRAEAAVQSRLVAWK